VAVFPDFHSSLFVVILPVKHFSGDSRANLPEKPSEMQLKPGQTAAVLLKATEVLVLRV